MFEHPMFNKSCCQASVHVTKTIQWDLVSFGRNKQTNLSCFIHLNLHESREVCQRSSIPTRKHNQIRTFYAQKLLSNTQINLLILYVFSTLFWAPGQRGNLAELSRTTSSAVSSKLCQRQQRLRYCRLQGETAVTLPSLRASGKILHLTPRI